MHWVCIADGVGWVLQPLCTWLAGVEPAEWAPAKTPGGCCIGGRGKAWTAMGAVVALSVRCARYAWQWCGANHAVGRTLGELFWEGGSDQDRAELQLHLEECRQKSESMRVTHLLPCFVPATLLVPQDGGVRPESPAVQAVLQKAQGGQRRLRCLGSVESGQDGVAQ